MDDLVERPADWKPCGEQRKFFGAHYEDGVCIDGYMWDLDSCDEPGGPLYLGGDFPCPNCNRTEWLCRIYDLDDGDMAVRFHAYREEEEQNGYEYQQGDQHVFADGYAAAADRLTEQSTRISELERELATCREDVIEECAKVCKGRAQMFRITRADHYTKTIYEHYINEAEECESAIRQLKGKK